MRSRASLATFSGLSRSKQNASDRQRRANGAQADERPAERARIRVARGTQKSNKDNQMKQNVMLTTASVLSILFFTFHLADDIVRGMEPGTLTNLSAVPI